MRVAEVIGTVTLARRAAELPPGALLLVRPLPRADLAGATSGTAEPLVAYDELGAGRGARVALSEGREAAMPFHPRPVPVDAYCAAIVDEVVAAREL